MRPKTVLLVSFHFPPSPAVGGLRIVNFAKHLPDERWIPIVLTVPAPEAASVDVRTSSGSSVKVIRTRAWPTLGDAYKKAKALIIGGSRGAVSRQEPSAAPGAPAGAKGWRQQMRRFVLSLLTVPDADRGWILPASARAVWEIWRGDVGCIVTSCPPYSAHVVGLIARLLTGTRWIADFRDPWMNGGSKKLYVTSRPSLAIDRWLERQVVKYADVVVGNTSALTASLRRGHPRQPSSKFVTITNSIDVGLFAQFWTLPKEPTFTIVYAGSLYFNRSPEPVFAAIRQLIDQHRMPVDGFNIVLIGNCETIDGVPTMDVARRHGVEGCVTVSPAVPYREALQVIRRSHVALLLAPAQPNQVPAKAYDYIGLGTEILALTAEGATADLVNTYAVGTVCDPRDVGGIAAFLASAHARAERPVPTPPQVVSVFDACANAARLATLMDGRLEAGAAPEVAA